MRQPCGQLSTLRTTVVKLASDSSQTLIAPWRIDWFNLIKIRQKAWKNKPIR